MATVQRDSIWRCMFWRVNLVVFRSSVFETRVKVRKTLMYSRILEAGVCDDERLDFTDIFTSSHLEIRHRPVTVHLHVHETRLLTRSSTAQ